tara:strand:+ start:141 stop:1400 length:1260 start_codon:yes stop_codon:yes gene_type:complete
MHRAQLVPLCSVLSCLLAVTTVTNAANWPDFRGPAGNGVVAAKLATDWSESRNVRWKIAVPGRGWSTPVAFDDALWMTSAEEKGQSLLAVCVGLDGKIRHRVPLFRVEKPAPINRLNSHASPSPVIEEGRVYVHFGTDGTACLDSQSGKVIWSRRDVNLDHQEGAGSSPILYGQFLIFHCDGRDRQYITALDKKTGKTAWQVKRSIDLSTTPSHARKAFSTPLVVGTDSDPVLVSPAAQGCYAYDPRTGRELWHLRYKGFSAVPRPIASGGLVYVITDFARPHLLAVRPGGRGDITDSHVDWKVTSQMPSTPSPVVSDGLIYTVSDRGGVVCCVDAGTGKLVWRHRLGGNFSASPIVAGGRLYFFDREGATTVMQAGRQARVLATSRLDDGLMASPAVVGNALILRTRTSLYRIEAVGN